MISEVISVSYSPSNYRRGLWMTLRGHPTQTLFDGYALAKMILGREPWYIDIIDYKPNSKRDSDSLLTIHAEPKRLSQ